jgi:hypothetical protein
MQPTNGQPTNGQPTMRDPDERPTDDQPTARRVTVAEAAVLLGLSEDAVRSRLKRGTLRKEKARDGSVLVVLGSDRPVNRPSAQGDRPTSTDQAADQPVDQGELMGILREQLDYMREQLNQEREANRENRRIIAGLVQRVPELEPTSNASSEAPESRETPSETQGKGTGPADDTEAQKPSFWRRLFLGE